VYFAIGSCYSYRSVQISFAVEIFDIYTAPGTLILTLTMILTITLTLALILTLPYPNPNANPKLKWV